MECKNNNYTPVNGNQADWNASCTSKYGTDENVRCSGWAINNLRKCLTDQGVCKMWIGDSANMDDESNYDKPWLGCGATNEGANLINDVNGVCANSNIAALDMC